MRAFVRRLKVLVPVVFLVALSACETDDPAGIASPAVFEAQGPQTCNLRAATRSARRYFPGNGSGSIRDQALELIDSLEADCAAGDSDSYTANWYSLAGLVQTVLGSGSGGDAGEGAMVMATTIAALGPDGSTPIFDPCDGSADCMPWEGYPVVPDFSSVLGSEDGAWAVVSGTSAVCSGFRYPCDGIDASFEGDVWGAEPSVDWEGAFHGLTTLVFGHPLPGPSPTGEPLLDTDLPAYQWLLIPDPSAFGVDLSPPAVVEVGLCSTATSQIDEILVQKGHTVLTEAVLDFCDSQIPSVADNRTIFGDLASSLASLLSPAPAPLIAAVASRGPGGSASSFTDFYAIDLPREALIVIPSEPANGTVGVPLLAEDGELFRVQAITSSMASPLENALITIEIIGNNGLIPSGNDITGANVTCDGFVCTGTTQADHKPAPGELELGLVISKPGSYTLCFAGSLPPLDFGSAVCTDKFVVNP